MMNAQQSYSDIIIPVIRNVRKMLLPHYGNTNFQNKQSDKKFELVTELDVNVERFLKTAFEKLYPDIAFVGEEGSGNRERARFWLVDPIDGTTPFIRGIPFCTTMVALIENGQVIFSAIYDFVNNIMYHAEKEKGAFANGAPIHVSSRTLRGAYLTWETHLDKAQNLSWFLRLREEAVLWHLGASGFEYTLIASGKLEGKICVDPHGKDYDFAAGTFLVSEAGGTVANIGKKTYDYRNGNFIASNSLVFKALTLGQNAIFPAEKLITV